MFYQFVPGKSFNLSDPEALRLMDLKQFTRNESIYF